MQAVQKELLEAGARAVRPGGVLVYSVCTFEPEETEGVVSWFGERQTEFRRTPIGEAAPPQVVSESGALLCLPHRHGTDGVFATRWERREVTP
jgi:16S rRNA (cytosine967-C5)-methyltransferase